jgi:hypothetical protein
MTPRLGSIRIGTRLTASYAAVVLLMSVGGVVAFWQVTVMRDQARRLLAVDQKAEAVLRVHSDVLTFRDQLQELTTEAEASRFIAAAPELPREPGSRCHGAGAGNDALLAAGPDRRGP